MLLNLKPISFYLSYPWLLNEPSQPGVKAENNTLHPFYARTFVTL